MAATGMRELLLLAALAAAALVCATPGPACTACGAYADQTCATFDCTCDPDNDDNYIVRMFFPPSCPTKPEGTRSWACCTLSDGSVCSLNRCFDTGNNTDASKIDDDIKNQKPYCTGDPGGVEYSVPVTETAVSFYIHDGINAGTVDQATAPCGGGGGGSRGCGTGGVAICPVPRTPAQMGCPASCGCKPRPAACTDTLAVQCGDGQSTINLKAALAAQTGCDDSGNEIGFYTSDGSLVASPEAHPCPGAGASNTLTMRATKGAKSCYDLGLSVNGPPRCTDCSTYTSSTLPCARWECTCDPDMAGYYRFTMSFNDFCKATRSWACCVLSNGGTCGVVGCPGGAIDRSRKGVYCSSNPGSAVYRAPVTETSATFFIHDGINAGTITQARTPCGGGGGGSPVCSSVSGICPVGRTFEQMGCPSAATCRGGLP